MPNASTVQSQCLETPQCTLQLQEKPGQQDPAWQALLQTTNQPTQCWGLRYLDGIANWGPRGALRVGFGNSGWHDGWPQGLGSRLEATLQHHLACREVCRLEAGCTAGCCWSLGLLHLGLWVRQRVHDGGGDGHRGQEVVRDLGRKNRAFVLVWLLQAQHNTQLLQTSQTTVIGSAGYRNNSGRQHNSTLAHQTHPSGCMAGTAPGHKS